MKGLDWLVAIMLVFLGICCLTMSATWLSYPESITHYSANLLKICILGGIPVFICGVIYFVITIRNRK